MHWKFTFEEHPMLLYADVSGDLTKEGIAKMSIEGITLARTKNCMRFIVDYRNAKLKGSETDIYQATSNLEETGLDRTDRIAILIKHNISAFEFAETVSSNRGWTQLKYFEDIGQARAWICK